MTVRVFDPGQQQTICLEMAQVCTLPPELPVHLYRILVECIQM